MVSCSITLGGLNKFWFSQIFAEGCHVISSCIPGSDLFPGYLGLDMFISTVTRKWSDICRSSTVIDWTKFEWTNLEITQFRIWPCRCVGRETCWQRSKESKSYISSFWVSVLGIVQVEVEISQNHQTLVWLGDSANKISKLLTKCCICQSVFLWRGCPCDSVKPLFSKDSKSVTDRVLTMMDFL